MNSQVFGSLTFNGTLNVTLGPPPDRCDVLYRAIENLHAPLLYFFGTTSTRPERLKINATQICFEWQVEAEGAEDADRWQAGILQTISHASWAAHYSDDTELRYRLNTEHGRVRDGRSAECLFFRDAHLFAKNGTRKV